MFVQIAIIYHWSEWIIETLRSCGGSVFDGLKRQGGNQQCCFFYFGNWYVSIMKTLQHTSSGTFVG